MSFVRSNFLILSFAFQFLGCSAGNIGYWEFKLLEKSIDTLGTIFKSEKSPVLKKIEVPKALGTSIFFKTGDFSLLNIVPSVSIDFSSSLNSQYPIFPAEHPRN